MFIQLNWFMEAKKTVSRVLRLSQPISTYFHSFVSFYFWICCISNFCTLNRKKYFHWILDWDWNWDWELPKDTNYRYTTNHSEIDTFNRFFFSRCPLSVCRYSTVFLLWPLAFEKLENNSRIDELTRFEKFTFT